jgi:hypothetical protein
MDDDGSTELIWDSKILIHSQMKYYDDDENVNAFLTCLSLDFSDMKLQDDNTCLY